MPSSLLSHAARYYPRLGRRIIEFRSRERLEAQKSSSDVNSVAVWALRAVARLPVGIQVAIVRACGSVALAPATDCSAGLFLPLRPLTDS